MDRPQMERGDAREWLRAEQHKRNDTREVRGKKGKRAVFFFLRKDRRAFACPPGGSRGGGARLSRPWAQAPPRKNAADCGTGWARNPAYRGLWPVAVVPAYPAYIPQIPMWEHRAGEMDGYLFSPHFVYIVYHKIWRLSKMESGRKWKGWKNLEGAGLRKMDMRKGVCGKEWKGGQVGAT